MKKLLDVWIYEGCKKTLDLTDKYPELVYHQYSLIPFVF